MLDDLLRARGASEALVSGVVDSGYYIRTWVDPFAGRTYETVSDQMYGNKQFSSSFEIDAFVDYALGKGNSFDALPPYRTLVAKTRRDIEIVLADPRRQHYLAEGTLSFRGQPREYTFKRFLANPVRANERGEELSILPGAYRQIGTQYSFSVKPVEQRISRYLVGNDNTAYDPMRIEQHYATQTRGLDVSFDVDVSLFFATHRFKTASDGKAYYESIPTGAHMGNIYVFRFRDPPVKKSAFLIRDFDVFKKYPPERILRQNCGLPLIGDHERNIAITDLECIIRLAPDFVDERPLTATDLFPGCDEDAFYRELLRRKDQYPDWFSEVVEYQWAR